ncbi:MAG: exopolyphosphatase / guanosine-5-triphosphate,3-diphosphate pyrophosphatase [Solirubrobacteraceae bacterium]|nr:exopolyphosphatase / guanosine-5-triphosphate,3-diphosphate pyrophosphatase [Solirubrobacteraceae bacterium]
MEEPRSLAVVDLGSNSFRLVVFTWSEGSWWKRTDEIHEAVRIGEGLDATGDLQPEPMERALETLELYAHFCRATGIEAVRPVATSAIRDAGNRDEFLAAARERSGLEVEVLDPEREAWFGYLAAVNSTTLSDGVVLDLGGGSMQLTRVRDRHAVQMRSWPLGAVRMTERFLTREVPKPKHLKALRAHVAEALAEAPWLAGAGAIAGIGGTVRNLAAAAELAAGVPSFGVQGFRLRRDALDALVERMVELPAAERGRLPGIKPARGDLILAGALVVQSVMEAGALDVLEVTEAGLREGVFFATRMADREPPLLDDVRGASVRNLAASYGADAAHAAQVGRLALALWDGLAAAGVHPGDAAERELLAAAAALHDIGMAIDYDDHHKHSRYLVLSAGLPGFSPRETALIAQMCRYHRKGTPALGDMEPLAAEGDAALLARCAAALRIAEQLERSRDQAVDGLRVKVADGTARIRLHAHEDVTVGVWAALRERETFELAFALRLEISAARRERPAARR